MKLSLADFGFHLVPEPITFLFWMLWMRAAGGGVGKKLFCFVLAWVWQISSSFSKPKRWFVVIAGPQRGATLSPARGMFPVPC